MLIKNKSINQYIKQIKNIEMLVMISDRANTICFGYLVINLYGNQISAVSLNRGLVKEIEI